MVGYLVKEGAKANLRESEWRTPLTRARENRDTNMLKLILCYQCQSCRKTVGGNGTPLLQLHNVSLNLPQFGKLGFGDE